MADGNQNDDTGSKTGPWDVVMYLTQRFPTFAVALLLLAAGVYGVKLTLDQKDEAQKELNAARVTIENERKTLRKEIDDLRQKTNAMLDQQRQEVAAAIARAAEKERAANQREAEAEATALKAVQKTLLDSAERIQKLFLGQLQSMEDLELLRTTASDELKNAQGRLQEEVTALDARREEILAKLQEAELKIRVAKVTNGIDRLAKSLNEASYLVKNAIDEVLNSFKVEDRDGLSAISAKIDGTKVEKLRGVLQYVLAVKTNKVEWAERFGNTLSRHPGEFQFSWFPVFFKCCDDTPEALWSAAFPAVTAIAGDESVPASHRFEILQYFDNRPDSWLQPLFLEDKYVAQENIWKVVAFIIKAVKGDYPKLSEDQRIRALDVLTKFDLAAAHVWADKLMSPGGLPVEKRANIMEFMKYWEKDFPVIKSKPKPALIAFWTQSDFVSMRDEYAEKGTSEDYKKPDK